MSADLAPGVLETERLVLRPRRVDEAAIFRALWTERDPRVPPHRRIDAAGRPTVADIAARIAAEPSGLLAVELRTTAEVIGYCGLTTDGHGGAGEPELAYELRTSAHGHGYATEAARAVVTWAASAGYPRVWAGIREWNVASRRVVAKLGFHETGRIEPDAEYGDTVLTVLEF